MQSHVSQGAAPGGSLFLLYVSYGFAWEVGNCSGEGFVLFAMQCKGCFSRKKEKKHEISFCSTALTWVIPGYVSLSSYLLNISVH